MPAHSKLTKNELLTTILWKRNPAARRSRFLVSNSPAPDRRAERLAGV